MLFRNKCKIQPIVVAAPKKVLVDDRDWDDSEFGQWEIIALNNMSQQWSKKYNAARSYY